MTLHDIANKLNTLDIPVRYRAFKKDESVSMPFITYQDTYSNNMSADGHVYAKIDNIQIDLYCKKKDINLENSLEEILNFTYWSKDTDVSDEEYVKVTYNLQILKGATNG